LDYNDEVVPRKLLKLIENGTVERHAAGDIFYALDFKEELYIVKSGYVKRYAMDDEQKVIESIYGPGYFFPLTPVFKKLLDFNLSQENKRYVYQAMTNLEIQGISSKALEEAVTADPAVYADLLLEAGVRLKANINRLASNALKDDYKKVAHQLVCLADEFGEPKQNGVRPSLRIQVPLEAIDIAEQLNLSVETVQEAFEKLQEQDLLDIEDRYLSINDMNLVKDVYL